jgi:DNA-binding NarL/FixJ family response regulator
MPGMDGLGFLDRLRVAQPAVAVVLLTESPNPELASAAFERGVKGVILKGSDPAALAPALRAAMRGENPRIELRVTEGYGLARREDAMVQARRRAARDGIAARLDALRALVDRAIFGNDYDWL